MKNGKKLQNYINKEYKEVLNSHEARLEIANKEMSEVKENLVGMKTDIEWVKKTLEKVDTRTWVILGTIVLGIVVQILMIQLKG